MRFSLCLIIIFFLVLTFVGILYWKCNSKDRFDNDCNWVPYDDIHRSPTDGVRLCAEKGSCRLVDAPYSDGDVEEEKAYGKDWPAIVNNGGKTHLSADLISGGDQYGQNGCQYVGYCDLDKNPQWPWRSQYSGFMGEGHYCICGVGKVATDKDDKGGMCGGVAGDISKRQILCDGGTLQRYSSIGADSAHGIGKHSGWICKGNRTDSATKGGHCDVKSSLSETEKQPFYCKPETKSGGKPDDQLDRKECTAGDRDKACEWKWPAL